MMILDKAAQPYQIVLTKIDKIKAKPLALLQERTLKDAFQYSAAHPQLMLSSSQKALGILELRAELAALAIP